MRILIALTYYRPHYSGLTIYAERQAKALAARGHQVTILTSRFDPQLPRREVCDGVEVVRLDVAFHISKGVIMPAMPAAAWRLARRADVINLHAPQFDAALIAAIGRLSGKRVILTYHCDLQLPRGPIHRLANIASDAANHITAGLAHAIVHNSRDYAEHSPFLRRYLHKLVPIYPPVEVVEVSAAARAAFRARLNLLPDQPVIGVAARLATEKGIEYLARALPEVLERFPTTRVLMVGPYVNVVGEEAYARRVLNAIKPISAHWTFLGVVPPEEMAAFFHECDVLALPSLNSTESFGLVQVEAMHCGTPVVASDLPGVRVPVSETGAGIVFAHANADALARAIIAVLEDPARYRDRGQSLALASTPQAVAAAYEALYLQP